jgi:hypothetical protein
MGISVRLAFVFVALALDQTEATPASAREDGEQEEEANCLLQARSATQLQAQYGASTIQTDNDTKKQDDAMKLKRLEAYFHPSAAGWAPKPVAKHVAATKNFVQAYADAMARAASDEGASWLALWDHAGNVALHDPFGTPVLDSLDAIGSFAKNLSLLSGVTVKEVFFSGDDNIFVASLKVSLNGATADILDVFTVNSDMKLIKLEAHWHPSLLGLAPKPVAIHDAMKTFVQNYANALARLESDAGAGLLSFWSTTGDIAFYDPVGTPVLDCFDALKKQFERIPPLSSVTVEEVFFSADDKIFCAILHATVLNGPTVPIVERYFLK